MDEKDRKKLQSLSSVGKIGDMNFKDAIGKPIRRTVPSDHVLVQIPDGRVIDGNVVFITDEVVLAPGQELNVGFQLPNRSPVRVVTMLVLLEDGRESIFLPPGLVI